MEQSVLFEKILRQEFGSYYIADGFDSGWENSIPELAHDSAIRLKRNLGDNSVQEFVSLLETLKQHPENPLVEMLSDETLIDWIDNPSSWQLLQTILGLITENLRKGLSV
jgi:hypothetical protein